MKKIAGVESVTVSLNQGITNIQLQPGNAVRIEQILRTVTNNGFTPKEARVRAIGKVISAEGKLKFQVAETGQSFDVIFDSLARDVRDAARKEIGRTIVIDGVIAFSKNKSPQTLLVKAVKRAGSEAQ